MTELKQYKITDDLSDVKMLDWIEGVGDITTYYELKFIHKFAEAIRSRPLSEALMKEMDISVELFEILDNIDTASDIAKGDDALYRSLVSQEHKKRFKYANHDGSYKGIESLRGEA